MIYQVMNKYIVRPSEPSCWRPHISSHIIQQPFAFIMTTIKTYVDLVRRWQAFPYSLASIMAGPAESVQVT
jgi:hypothetical protein